MFYFLWQFICFICRLVYVYIWYIFPVVLIISLIFVLLGMAIKVGLNAGFGIMILLASIIIFSNIVYGGEKSFNILRKIWNKIKNFFFSGYSILKGDDINNSSNTANNNN